MAFIAIDAKADVLNSKKGKLTPAQHAQLNAWCLANKTGILDWGGKCESTAQSYSVINGIATVVFHKGYIVICGRLVECEENSTVEITAPTSGFINGSIILRYNLNSSGNDEFQATTTTANLTQQDLNDNPISGVYEFELYRYMATNTTVILTRNTEYVPDIGGKLEQFITTLTGTGVIGSGNPPLQGYDKSKGTIEARLTDLGFKKASITNPNTDFIDARPTEICSLGKILYGVVYLKVPSTSTDVVENLTIATISNSLPPYNKKKIGELVQRVNVGPAQAPVYWSKRSEFYLNTNNTITVEQQTIEDGGGYGVSGTYPSANGNFGFLQDRYRNKDYGYWVVT